MATTPKNLARGMRSHYCGEIGERLAGESVSVCGWADRRREHGEHLAFVDLRDHTGVVQCVVDERIDVRSEYVLRITGVVRERPEGTANENLLTGAVEIGDCEVEVLSRAEPPPFSLHGDTEEATRLRHRYVDLRSERMQRNLRTRAKVNASFRKSMEAQGFLEVETPMLIASTPEGARDFVVPSRLHQGRFYALPQSPQLFKQLCMVGGIDRYYQIARCLRDEDLRADRQFEFMQLDIEASFVAQDDIIAFVSSAIAEATEAVTGERLGEIPTITWHEAMERFGTDKPDMRFGLELVELTELFAQTEAKVFQASCVKGFCVPEGAKLGRNRIDDLTKKTQEWGAKGLAWFRVGDGGELDGALTRFMSEDEQAGVLAALEGTTGNLLLLVADERPLVNRVLGQLRLEVGQPSSGGGTGSETGGAVEDVNAGGTRASFSAEDTAGNLHYVWVVDFPLFEGVSDDGIPIPAHHPFTMVHPDDLGLLAEMGKLASGESGSSANNLSETSSGTSDITAIRSQAYDLVLNGWELGSGSVRINDPTLQQQVFTLLGIPEHEAKERFGFLLDAFRYGVPPHAGFAVGIDRLVAILLGEDTIREVIAYPKTQSGADMLTGAPSHISPRHLKELSLRPIED